MMKVPGCRFVIMVWVTVFVAAAATGIALGETSSQKSMMDFEAFQASETIGSTVKSQQGEELGKIDDVIYDSNGRIAFLVVDNAPSLGLEEKKIAVPYSAFSRRDDGNQLVLYVTKEQIRNAQPFDPRILRDSAAASEIYRYYGQQPYFDSGVRRDIREKRRMPDSTIRVPVSPPH